MPDDAKGGGKQVEAAEPKVVAEIMDALDALPPARRQEMATVLYQHVGPLPDPGTFAAYGAVYVDAPREILDMAVRQQKHDIEIAEKSLDSEISYRRETLQAATAVLVCIIGASTALGVTGHEAACIAMAGAGGVVVAAGALVQGRELFGSRGPPAPPQPQPPAASTAGDRGRPGRPPNKGRRG